jgi:hopene-associated glycosyltransferase HpnB
VIVLALLPLLIWLYLIIGRAGFWLVGLHLPPRDLPRVPQRRVAVVIPARDEAESIAGTVRSLRTQTLPPSILIVVDDNSSDGTGDLARAAGALTIKGKPLPEGWSGKLWALTQGIGFAETPMPDYFLFTDADITHNPRSIEQLVAIAEKGPYDLVSFMVRLQTKTWAERALIPAFVFFFLMLYPPGKTPGAAGGCLLIRPSALRKAGGLEAIRAEVIDDCALAKAVARQGGKLWLGLARETYSTRVYGTFGDVGRMISRTAFNQLRHSTLLLVGTLLGLFVTYLLPVVLLFSGHWLYAGLGMAAWLLMSLAYVPTVLLYDVSFVWAFALPAIATFYAGATLHSALQYRRGAGGMWKGRAQDRDLAQSR